MTDRDRTRRIAIQELCAMPDEEDVTRAHRWTCEGDERRYELVAEFAAVYIQHSKVEELDGEEIAW